MTAAGGQDATGVGLCLGAVSAVMAVIRQNPLRLAAVATLTWPAELWQPGPPPYLAMSAGQRVLARARHQLGLRRWCPVAVVAGPSLSHLSTPEWVLPRGAELLARAALAQGWMMTPDRAAALRAGTHLTVAAELSAAMAGAEAEADLAVGAAIAILLPPDRGKESPGVGPAGAESTLDRADAVDKPSSIVMTVAGMERAGGWAVQRTGHPAGSTAHTNRY